jgi:hypothetical protein
MGTWSGREVMYGCMKIACVFSLYKLGSVDDPASFKKHHARFSVRFGLRGCSCRNASLGAYLKRTIEGLTYRQQHLISLLLGLAIIIDTGSHNGSRGTSLLTIVVPVLGTVSIRIPVAWTRPYRIPLMWISIYRSFLAYKSL